MGGLHLPEELLETIADGRWKPPQNTDILRRIFGDEPDGPQFYDFATMVAQNRFFHSKSAAELEEDVPGSNQGLGIDPALAVLIGSLGTDMPIALDYRTGRSTPRIIYLMPDGWREVAPDFATLARQLDL
ncbi:hypothetical protein [Microbispora sp. NPDC049125]|uniref:hypothetical protein n=1 Tax=Microbispora sp. NPDC049125 TaxID=3154929 RepID=UPI0034654C1D